MKVKKWNGLVLFALVLTVGACAINPRVRPAEPIQTGLASWYGPGFHGRDTSSREIYNMYELTAAHRTLPFGTWVVVTNLDNGRSVRVKINDRGPFVKGRIIDLSLAAARVLGMVGPGVIPVRIDVLPEISPPLHLPEYSVQVGSFTQEQNAVELLHRLKPSYPYVYITRFSTANQVYFRVRIRAGDQELALALAKRLTRQGFSVLLLEEQ